MGARLVSFYDQAAQIAGLQGKVKIAMITKIPGQKAAELPDTPENIEIFRRAIEELKKSA